MANMITSGKQKVTGKSVLLFSGGMDSLMFDYSQYNQQLNQD